MLNVSFDIYEALLYDSMYVDEVFCKSWMVMVVEAQVHVYIYSKRSVNAPSRRHSNEIDLCQMTSSYS